MDFQQIRDFVNPAVAQATGLQEVDNLQMPVPVAYVPVQIVIDGALSLTSENPVQNKVIAVAIQNLDGRITAIEGQFSEGVTEAVNNWLAAHPEATTTVQDGAITYAKLDANLKGEVDQISDLISALNYSDLILIGRENLINDAIWQEGKYIKGDGTIGDNLAYKLSSIIPVNAGSYSFMFTNPSGYARIVGYDSSDTPQLIYSAGTATKAVASVTIPSGIISVRCSLYSSGIVYGLIQGKSVDNEISALKETETANTNAIISIRRFETALISCSGIMRFNTSANTLTIPKNWYLYLGSQRYNYESEETVINYGSVSGSAVIIVTDSSGHLSAIAPASINFNNHIPLFTFLKNSLNNPATNNIRYPYYVNGTLYNSDVDERIVYVNGSTGSDSNDGTASNPFATIQKAINANATLIYVARGSYNETITIHNKTRLKIMPLSTPTFNTSVFDVPMIIVNSVDCRVCRQIDFIDVYANNPSGDMPAWYIDNVYDANFMHCWASNAVGGGFVTVNLYGRFIQCKAWDIGDSSHQNSDGFNLHGYGTTELIDCIAYDCYDDGISHHDGCVATIKGGEFWNCTHGGGIAPVNRYTEIDGAYCHDNAWGIQATQADVTLYDPYILIKNSVLKNNVQKDIQIGEIPCKVLRCSFDTKEIPAGAQYTEIS